MRVMEQLSLGVIGKSRKPDEHRLPIHPAHLDRIDPRLRSRIVLEAGYGEHFGYSDERLARLVGGVSSRTRLIAECDVCVLSKPVAEDLAEFRPGHILWGWPHCVQDAALTQVAIDRRLTIIAWEGMNHWGADGRYQRHVFQGNNQLAGYASVLHSMTLTGVTGAYGRPLRAVVIGYGATARGAVRALIALGVADVTVVARPDGSAAAEPIPGAQLVPFEPDPRNPGRAVVPGRGSTTPLVQLLSAYDIVVNCILQDTDAPLVFVTTGELDRFAPTSLFVDVSCDEGMGFEWARATSFDEPVRRVGAGISYYAVDHSPSLLWDSATWEISEALLPYLGTVLSGPEAWQSDETIRRAIEIREGVVQNPKILSFQGRAEPFPHPATG